MAGYDLGDYREVPERVKAWYGEHEDARIETFIVENTERVVVRAEVYRTTDQERPSGTGHSYLAYPGQTPYTKGSELENAETSAIGRALFAAGVPTKGAATGHEIAMKGGPTTESLAPSTSASSGSGQRGEDGRSSSPPTITAITAAQARALRELFPSPAKALAAARAEFGKDLPSLNSLTVEQAQQLVATLQGDDGGGYN